MEWDEIIRKGIKRVDQVEIYEERSRIIVVDVEKGEIKRAEVSFSSGVGIRVLKGKRLGFAYGNTEAAEKILEEAIKGCEANREDPNLPGFAPESRPSTVEGLFDSRLDEMEPEEVFDMVKAMVEASKISDKVYSVSASMEVASTQITVINSEGLDLTEKRTVISAGCYVSSRDGSRASTGSEIGEGRCLESVDPERIGRTAGERAIASLNSVQAETGEYPMVILPRASPKFLGFLVGSAANADNLQHGRSFLTGKLGTMIGREEISLIDDGLLAGRLGSRSFDDEGTPTGRTYVVREGVFESAIYDRYTAHKEGRESTGNARRSYSSIPSVERNNVVLSADKISGDDVMDVKKGILLISTGDSPNLANGEFSGLISEGFLIENGEITKGLKGTNFCLNLLDLLKNVEVVGKEVRDIAGVIAPPIRIRKVRIAGS